MKLDLAKPPEKFLEKTLAAISGKLDSMNMYEVVKHVYEATFYKYAILTLEEKFLREKAEKKIIEKVGREDDFYYIISKMYFQLDQTRAGRKFLKKEIHSVLDKLGLTFHKSPIGKELPEEGEEETEPDIGLLALHEGGPSDPGPT